MRNTTGAILPRFTFKSLGWRPSARQRVLLLLNFSFLLLTFRLGIHQRAEIRSDQTKEKFKKGGHRGGRHN